MSAQPLDRDRPSPDRVKLATLLTERSVLLADRERLVGQLADLEEEHRRTCAELENLVAVVTLDTARRRSDEAADLASELAILRRDRALLDAELERTRRERDQLRVDLLNIELGAALTGDLLERVHEDVGEGPARAELAAMTELAAALQRELTAHHQTVSWRVTAPLRVVRRWQLRP